LDRALQAQADLSHCEVRIVATWSGGEASAAGPPGESLTISATPYGQMRARVRAADRVLELQIDGEKQEWSLPGKSTWKEVSLSARLVALADRHAAPLAIEEYFDRPIRLNLREGWLRIGREVAKDSTNTICLFDRRVALRHGLIVRRPGAAAYWIVNLDAEIDCGTFVNGDSMVVRQLHSGDLVQIGPYAWTFSRVGDNGYLLPVRQLAGIELELRQVERDLLRGVTATIPAGSFVAVTGPSGGGKSTLLRAILSGCDQGTIVARECPGVDGGSAGHDISAEREWFRGVVRYVSQQDVVHERLSASQGVRFISKLRGDDVADAEIESVLRQVEIDEAVWHRPCHKLSGGESKRWRTAAEILAEPRLLILDEPASGLDRGREQTLMRLLRTMCRRGCTVIMVTHSLHHLTDFDRVLVLRDGRQVFWGVPEALRELAPGRNLEQIDWRQLQEGESPLVLPLTAAGQAPVTRSFIERLGTNLRQLATLCQREWRLLVNDSWSRLAVPLFVLPLFFALAIGASVRPKDQHLLGFLAVLACIWMGSSLSLMLIVNEREVFEHERLRYLRVVPYIGAKMLVHGLLSLMVTGMFVAWLGWCRGPDEMLRYIPVNPASKLSTLPDWYYRVDTMLRDSFFVLSLVSLAAVGQGLLISAAVNRKRPLASLILALVMLGQVVLSVEVAGSPQGDLEAAYGEFHIHHCNKCLTRRAQCWSHAGETSERQWLCKRCQGAPRQSTSRPSSVDEDRMENRQRPNWGASLVSYATLSRYGDIALRSRLVAESDANSVEVSAWGNEAIGVLIACCLGFPATAGLILTWQRKAS